MAKTPSAQRQRNLIAAVTLLIGTAAVIAVVALKPKPIPQPRPQPPAPEVTVITASPESVTLNIAAQGTVEPKVAVDLVARVSGQIVSVAPEFAAGGFFNAGQTLLSIEPADYQFAVARARSQLAKANEALAVERGRARQAKREWRDLGDEVANSLFLREPQLAAAQSAQLAAQADLDKALLDLERTTLELPFNGRVEQINVNVGQFVTAGSRLGRLFASDTVEIRLPLTLRQAELIALPQAEQQSAYPTVTITLSDLLDERQWQGQLVRSEAALDRRSRMLVAIAEVNGAAASQLPIGAFVEAQITGKSVANALQLPRSALYRGNQILLVDSDNRIHFHQVQVIQNRQQTVVVRGIEPAARVVTSKLSLAIEGMQVTPLEDGASPENGASLK